MKFVRTLTWAGVMASMVLAAIAAPVAAASNTLVVDDDGAQCKKADFTTISAAVAAASAGTKIQVCAGTYTEQVSIPAGKDGLTLEAKGSGTATIKAPAVMVGNKAIVEVTTSQDVKVKGFTISGPGGGGCDSIRYGVRLQGGADATIEKNHITLIQDTPFSGCQNGNAIQVGRQADGQTATAKIKDNLIDAFQKSGIVVDNTGSHADIDKNEIVGVGPTATIAQNGIQISRGATADVHNNDVSDLQYSPQSVASAGILLFSAGAVDINHNSILRADEGVYVISTDNAVISHNESSDNSFDGFGLDDSSNVTLSHNEANDNGFDGIWVDADATGNTFDHNKLFGNGEHDAHDNAFASNTWSHTQCDTDFPAGQIC